MTYHEVVTMTTVHQNFYGPWSWWPCDVMLM